MGALLPVSATVAERRKTEDFQSSMLKCEHNARVSRIKQQHYLVRRLSHIDRRTSCPYLSPNSSKRRRKRRMLGLMRPPVSFWFSSNRRVTFGDFSFDERSCGLLGDLSYQIPNVEPNFSSLGLEVPSSSIDSDSES